MDLSASYTSPIEEWCLAVPWSIVPTGKSINAFCTWCAAPEPVFIDVGVLV
jgi:hypothetical protein